MLNVYVVLNVNCSVGFIVVMAVCWVNVVIDGYWMAGWLGGWKAGG